MPLLNEHVSSDLPLSEQAIQFYQDNGFLHVHGVLNDEEVARFKEAALEMSEKRVTKYESNALDQTVNVWPENEALKELTMHPTLAAAASKLAGVKLRLWHDQILIKKPHNKAPTEFHQDQPYWPHENSPNPISAWIALCDVPVERGCMSFIPGTHKLDDLPEQNLQDADSLFTIRPELRYAPRVTLPLKEK